MNRAAPRFVWLLNKAAESVAKIAKHVSQFFLITIAPRKSSIMDFSRIFLCVEKKYFHTSSAVITVPLTQPTNNLMIYQSNNADGVNLSLGGLLNDCGKSIDFPAMEFSFGITLTVRKGLKSAWRICSNCRLAMIYIKVSGKIWRKIKKDFVNCYIQFRKPEQATASKTFHLRV